MQRKHKILAATVGVAALVGGTTVASAVNPAPETYAFVARGDNPVDALSAAPLAGRLNAPVILTEQNTLTEDARDALADADPDNVLIAGGLLALTEDVESAIKSLLPDADVRRLAGGSRYDTSELLAGLFGEIEPSFLGVDGTANAAETAATATNAKTADNAANATNAATAQNAANAAALGGLDAEAYASSNTDTIVETEDPVVHPAGREESLTDVLPPVTFTAPADGTLSAEGLVLVGGPIESTALVLTLDFPSRDLATDTPEEALALELALINGLLGIGDLTAGISPSLAGSRFVEAGETVTLRLQVGTVNTSPSGANAPVEENYLLRRLSYTFTPGAGSFDPLTEDELPRRSSGGTLLPDIFGSR